MSEFSLYAVAGNPILQSRSPQIYNPLFRYFKMNAHYIRLSAESAEEALKAGKEMGLCGLNLTAPLKEDAVPLLHKISPDASKIKAVNLVLVRSGKLSGYNTDPEGVVKALTTNGVSIPGKRCAVLGAGGAGKAAVYSLVQEKAARITLLNRTVSKARKAAHDLGCAYAPLEQLDSVIRDCDIFISCVPCFPEKLFDLAWPRDLHFLNAVYKNSLPGRFFEQNGMDAISGLEWLLYQGFASFRLSAGKKIPGPVKASVREQLIHQRNERKSNIALIGFMGSGKTAVGRALADIMHSPFFDSDRVIEEAAGCSIRDIFKNKGEAVFRNMERSLLSRVLEESKDTVFSLGGGAVLDSGTVEALKKSCHIIWLWTPLEKALQRAGVENRPLLADFSQEKIEKLFMSRVPHYARASDMVIPAKGPVKKIAERIKNEIHQTIQS
jgi:shikimate dehydrogenase